MDYLLFLQNIRFALGDSVEQMVTKFSDIWLILALFVPYLIYWAYDKEFGTFMLTINEASGIMNGILKVTACINRPWILDSRIKPSDGAKLQATGYSFPSGHTTATTALCGTTALTTKRKWLKVLCFIIIPLVMLSRNYLGVHTLKDVLVGFISTMILILLAFKIREFIRKKNISWGQILIATIIICTICGAYTLFKPYPVSDIVDPKKLRYDTLKSIVECLGLIFGFWLEEKFIKFTTDKKDIKTYAIRIVIGFLLLYTFNKYIVKAIGIIGRFFLCILGTFIIPFIFTRVEKIFDKK